jgi:hypothetical protein
VRKSNRDKARELLARGILTDEQALAADREKHRASRTASERLKIVKALEKQLAETATRQAYLDALAAAPDPEPYRIEKKRGQKSGNAATYVMGASDWHLGERVRPETVGFKNEYNPEIAVERATQYWASQLLMLEAARSAWDIRDGILWLGGDLITGYIHEEYLEENFLSPVEEALLVHQVVGNGIKTLLARSDFERILVVTSNGNHGRTGQRMKISTSAKNSFEWLAYQHLRMAFADEKRLTFQIGTGYSNLVDVYGFRINFHHGDMIGYQGGIGGTTIPANRRIQRQASALPPRFEGTSMGPAHLNVHGHFHSLSYPGLFIQNGSLIGWNAFAEAIGCSYQDPQQVSFVVDERYRVVSNFNPILVTKPKKWARGG